MVTKKTTSTEKRSTSGSSEGSGAGAQKRTGTSRASAPRAEAKRKKTGSAIAVLAAKQLLEVTGKEMEGVTALERTDDGWSVQVEVLEVRRIPDTTDVLGLYEVQVDSDGELLGYRRQQRYVRGAPNEDGR
jgi:hypothetical protein